MVDGDIMIKRVRRSERQVYLTGDEERPLPGSRHRAAVPTFLVLAAGLMIMSRLGHPAVQDARLRLLEFAAPHLGTVRVFMEPLRWVGNRVEAFFLHSGELSELRRENQKLKSWQWRARELERKLEELSAVSRIVQDRRSNFVTVRVIAQSPGALVQSALINAGAKTQLKSGYPVLSGEGLVGRVVEVGATAARVLLLTDPSSRVAVFVGKRSVRAVLSGDNRALPRLSYVVDKASISDGDVVSTSGLGGFFPRGLPIGTVVATSQGPRVRLNANIDKLEYLSVLFHDMPTLDLVTGAVPVPPGHTARGGNWQTRGGR